MTKGMAMASESQPGGGPKRRDARPIVWMIGFLVVAACVYFVLLGRTGVQLIATGTVTGIGLGVGVLLLPLVGAWVLYATLRAGIEHQVLARAAVEAGRELDVSQLPRRRSGRIERDAADELFARVRAEWEADPEDWRNTYRVARAYDYAGDRSRARAMMKRAWAQYRRGGA
ncbi:hypothetical protein GCM10009624_09370 [Gordonia sinesedis]